MRRMGEDNLRFALPTALRQKTQPFDRQERHVAAYDQIPFAFRRTLGGSFKRSDDSPERPFPGPSILDDLHTERFVLSAHCNDFPFLSGTPQKLDHARQHEFPVDFNKRLVPAKSRASTPSEHVARKII